MFGMSTHAVAVDYPFSVTTINLSLSYGHAYISFDLSAQGVFTVDCGSGGTLSGDGVSGNTIDRSSTTEIGTYTCAYSTGGVKTIGFDGEATLYNDYENAINFSWSPSEIEALSGDLSEIFPELGEDPTDFTLIPTFWASFSNANNLTSISGSLFSGYTIGIDYMFYETFKECTSLTSIPDGLFSGISVVGEATFEGTFSGCSGLSGYIPPSLFAGLIAEGSPYDDDLYSMYGIFEDTSLATSCPPGMTTYTTGYEDYWDGHVSCQESATAKTVTYTCGTGSGTPPASAGVDIGDSFVPATNSCVPPSGYRFSGWLVSGTSDIRSAGTSFTWEYTENKTFTAQYVRIYTVSYSCGNNNGTAPSNTTVAVGDTFTAAANTCIPPNGYGFSGWKISGTNVLVPIGSSTFTWGYTENKTLTAEMVPTFSVITTNLVGGDTFTFVLDTAVGTFYVDCGEGGTLSGNGVSGNTITKSRSKVTYTCTYSTGGVKTIVFSGHATGYHTNQGSAISFSGNTKVAELAGDLSVVFPVGDSLRFTYTFKDCINLTKISENLFGSYRRLSPVMFSSMFYGCTSLTEIPENLFSFGGSNVAGQSSAFYGMFWGCSGLTEIPDNLFSHVTSGGEGMFSSVFRSCTGLTEIPANLFGNNNMAGQPYMFAYAFVGCTGITSLPQNLFSHITSGAEHLFDQTFYNCSGLTSIPGNLFSNITTGANGMFNSTFEGCSGLTALPENLFTNITTSASGMFYRTFAGCGRNLTGYIPPLFFDGLITRGSPYSSSMMDGIFVSDGLLATSCSSFPGKQQYITGYENYWSGRVSCGPAITCNSGYYLPAGSKICNATCPSGYSCPGGAFGFHYQNDQGKTTGVNLTWDGESISPSFCTLGDTFVPPTPEPRPGYIFTGWKVKTVTP